MARSTLIFGNGLGMALDPNYFSLDRAIGEVWDSDELLDAPSKQLIQNCLPTDNNDRPHGEDDLDTLQLALSACDLLSRIGETRIHWLSEEGKKFPTAVRQFIYQTAIKFHGHAQGLPTDFVDSLAAFVRETKSHIATLNYDNLLYQPLIDREILKGYSGALVDGFYSSTGFAEDNLERKYGRTFGYYLHLHGSPLFVDRDHATHKLHQGEVGEEFGTFSSHIVLTHFKHKPTVISASELLSSYWQKLIEAISESEEILLVGYSGFDEHLNALLRSTQESSARVIEWAGSGELADRVTFWSDLLAREVTVAHFDSILEFRDWAAQ